jgi:hypothetical protein
MDEATNCERLVLIDAGRIVAQGSPAAIVAAACPERVGADLNDAFIRLMARGKAPAARTANRTAAPSSPDIDPPSPSRPGDPGGIDA